CTDFAEARELAETLPGIIFITIGKNHIETVLDKISDKKRVRVRVLPQSETIAQLEGLGLNADQIIALKGPFSEEMNLLMLKETEAASLICKDSGKQGGTDAKLEAALKLGIKTLMIKRPRIDYPNKYQDVAELINYVSRKNCFFEGD
ncbi:MAG: precorrin-6A/cobalt-precorrin-6A reductase, partial [Desulfitobacteriaceae bacterium]|nr:precorrin-6A/cobalt-precorrin-6A reductase [Desulfitobacteriaceae bacterium]